MADVGLQTHTMWSETLLENLYSQLKQDASDDQLRRTLQELQDKNIPGRYLVRCVNNKVGSAAANRTERLLFGGVTSAGDGAKAGKSKKKPRPSSSKGGLLSGLKKMLNRQGRAGDGGN